jgi:alpha-tubulin suppressor-like RCC1 family protein
MERSRKSRRGSARRVWRSLLVAAVLAALAPASATAYAPGALIGFGANYYGALGVGGCEPEKTCAALSGPAEATGLPPLSTTTAAYAADGNETSYAVLSSGNVYAAGENNGGQLGNGCVSETTCPAMATYAPVVSPSGSGMLSGVTQVAAGSQFALALAGGEVYSWGTESVPCELGDGCGPTTGTPVLVCAVGKEGECGTGPLTGITSIAAGWDYGLAVQSPNGQVLAWGENRAGQLGQGDVDGGSSHGAPLEVKGVGGGTLTGAKQVAASNDDNGPCMGSLALMNDGTVRGWGCNEFGEAGVSPEQCKPCTTPQAIPGLEHVKEIAGGFAFAMALLEDGTVEVWGQNRDGELGNGKIDDETHPPTLVPGLSGVVAIAGGGSNERGSAVALLADGQVMAWGSDAGGQLGFPSTSCEPCTTPQLVPGLSNIAAIFSGPVSGRTQAIQGSPLAVSGGGGDGGGESGGKSGGGGKSGSGPPIPVAGLAADPSPAFQVASRADEFPRDLAGGYGLLVTTQGSCKLTLAERASAGLAALGARAKRHARGHKLGLIRQESIYAPAAGTYTLPIVLTAKGRKLAGPYGRHHKARAHGGALLAAVTQDPVSVSCTPLQYPQLTLPTGVLFTGIGIPSSGQPPAGLPTVAGPTVTHATTVPIQPPPPAISGPKRYLGGDGYALDTIRLTVAAGGKTVSSLSASLSLDCNGAPAEINLQNLPIMGSTPGYESTSNGNYEIVTGTINGSLAEIRISYYVGGCSDASGAGFYTLKEE